MVGSSFRLSGLDCKFCGREVVLCLTARSGWVMVQPTILSVTLQAVVFGLPGVAFSRRDVPPCRTVVFVSCDTSGRARSRPVGGENVVLNMQKISITYVNYLLLAVIGFAL